MGVCGAISKIGFKEISQFLLNLFSVFKELLEPKTNIIHDLVTFKNHFYMKKQETVKKIHS